MTRSTACLTFRMCNISSNIVLLKKIQALCPFRCTTQLSSSCILLSVSDLSSCTQFYYVVRLLMLRHNFIGSHSIHTLLPSSVDTRETDTNVLCSRKIQDTP